MKYIMFKTVITAFFILLSASNASAQNNTLTDAERKVLEDSLIAEVEKSLGLNDNAYSAKAAKDKWLSGKAMFLLQGGIAPVVYQGQKQFKKKYHVGYDDFGCIVNCSERQMKIYNTFLMDFLTDKFGDEWRKDIRPDVPGLEEYGRDVFKNVKYDENGIATLVLPVIIKSCGRSADFYEDDEKIIKGLIDYEYPMTSIAFLYRGKEYYIPLSDMELDNLPTTEDPYEITIRLFNPKVFRYSKKTKPYPYGIIERTVPI